MAMYMSPLWISAENCGINATVTTQADVVDLGNIPRTGAFEVCFNNITINNAQGTLTFDNISLANGVYVQDSPDLEALSFPDLISLSALGVNDTPVLSNISFPRLQSVGLLPFGDGGWTVPPPWPESRNRNLIDVRIAHAPALKTLEFDYLAGFLGLELIDADSLGDFSVSDYDEGIVNQINSSLALSLDGCFAPAPLVFSQTAKIVGRPKCEYLLLNWHSTINLTLVNTAQSNLDILFPFLINGTLTASELYLPPENASEYGQAFYFVSSIGQSAQLTSSSNVDLSLDHIESLGGSLVAGDNTNCTFSFKKLSEIEGNISMTDNPDSTLPWFPDLRRAANIHLRGNIDTSQGPNIFPALTTVPGTVTIEAWNSDFSCSQLAKQAEAGIIQHLVCNGTGDAKGGASSSVSGGIWTGVGVAMGLMILQNLILG